MAKNKFQLDRKKADLDKDGKLSKYEEAKGEAIQKAMDNYEIPKMAHGGMPCGMMSDPMPIGSTDAEVADDITAMISENEYVLPANVVKRHGLKHIMSMHDEAKMGFMMMQDMGLLVAVDGEMESDSEGSENAEVSDEGDTEQEETEETIETPQGNEIEVAGVETEYSDPEVEETDEYLASYYGKMSDYGMMNKQRFAFIV